MTTKHTPGSFPLVQAAKQEAEFTPSMKWLQNCIANRLADLTEIDPDKARFVAACTVSTIHCHRPELTAAPDLLEACEELLAEYEEDLQCGLGVTRDDITDALNSEEGQARLMGNMNVPWGTDPTLNKIKQARAAIAKAKPQEAK